MFVNIVIFVFSVAIASLLFKFGIATTPTLKPFAQRMLPAFAVVLLFLGVNTCMALYAKHTIKVTLDLPAIDNQAELIKLPSGAPMALVAIASPDNPIRGRNNEYLAYVDGNGLWTPREILFDLDDIQISMENDTYRVRNWKRDNKLRYINPCQEVVIVGENIIYERATGAEKGKLTNGVKGILVYAGSHAQFVKDTTRRLWGPRIMAGLNAFAFGAITLCVIIAAIKIAIKKPA